MSLTAPKFLYTFLILDYFTKLIYTEISLLMNFRFLFGYIFAISISGLSNQVMPEDGVSHWLKNPHSLLHNYRSSTELPIEVGVLIIGSGLGGLGAAELLSHHTKQLKVAVVDSRGVAEGATSNNGGNFQP